jgi:tRNA pseudouridine13 synthase
MIKRVPDDFQVEEILTELFLSLAGAQGPFALYGLHKRALATPEAVGHLARALSTPAGAWAYAGLKDKHASSSQHLTLKLEGLNAAPEQAVGPGWRIERLAFVPRSITAADIQGNRFKITVRNLSPEQSADMDEAAKLLAAPPTVPALRVVNYFGDQRFGSARHGQGFIGKQLCLGDFEAALRLAIATESRKDRMEQKVFKRTLREDWGRWREVLPRLRRCPERRAVERLAHSSKDFRAAFCALPYLLQQLSVYAYQSWLWNSIARNLIAHRCAPLGPVLAADDPFGEMLFPAAAAVPPDLAGLQLPLLARKTVLAPPWQEAAEEVLKAEGLEVARLHIAGVRRPFFGEEPRALFVSALEFALGPAQPDEGTPVPGRFKRLVSFALPRGSYATVVLRALGQ